MNPHVVELLNLALEASADLPIIRRRKKFDLGASLMNGAKVVGNKGLNINLSGMGSVGEASMNTSWRDESMMSMVNQSVDDAMVVE